jgi:hypothetical protein
MATVPTVYDWIAHDGLFATAADLEAGVGDVLSFLMNPPECQVRRGTAQSIPNSTVTAIAFDTEDIDNDGMHSTVSSTTRLTIQTTGRYQISGVVAYDVGATGGREARIVRNGSAVAVNGARVINDAPSSGGAEVVVPALQVSLTAGDYLELMAFQSNGGALNTVAINGIYCTLRARWIGT